MWAICIVDTLCTPGQEFEKKTHLEFQTSQFLFFISYLTSKTLILGVFFRLIVLLLQLITKNFRLKYIFRKPLQFRFQKCIDIYWSNILSFASNYVTLSSTTWACSGSYQLSCIWTRYLYYLWSIAPSSSVALIINLTIILREVKLFR